jgi:phosphatidylserine/phosphatidylglycerophosphate/cardiolipin synthase-like enzyme
MHRRLILSLLAITVILGLAACSKIKQVESSGSVKLHQIESSVSSSAHSVLSSAAPDSSTVSTGPNQVVSVGALTAYAEPAYGYSFVPTAIAQAHDRVYLVMYELSDAQVISALEAAHHRGVDVRVLLDSAYHGRSYNTPAFQQLQSAGVPVRWAPASTIVHQKTLVVDNRAWIMTGNLTPQYYSSSVDFTVMDQQAQDVAEIAQAFIDDWNGDLTNTPSSAQITGAHGDLIFSPESESTLVGLINQAVAGSTMLVENEEMNSSAIESALEQAAHRGVDVRVVMTNSSSWASAFNQLVANGVHVATYASNAPIYIHAKAIVINNNTAYVGSINFSTASMIYNRELGVITSDPQVVQQVISTINHDYTGAQPWH